MGRRTRGTELGFGSDSFLDIIANIVGILIILIVVAGMRVRGAPVPPASLGGTTDPEEVSHQAALVLPAVAPKPPPQRSPELVRRVRAVEKEIADLQAESKNQLALLNRADDAHTEVRQRMETLSNQVAEDRRDLKASAHELVQTQAALDRARQSLAELRTKLQQVRAKKPPVEQITHRLTPLSRTVEGKELHFRLAENRVAPIPINELIDRLRFRVERQKRWLAKFRRHQGTVGPIGGFTMEYVVERKVLSTVEKLRYGRATMRIGVSQWRLKVEPTLESETPQEALRPASKFHLALHTADPETTLTFWVYPDSFRLFRRLQKLAHGEGFTVAARPLPFGAPIAGSPRGSKSAGQ